VADNRSSPELGLAAAPGHGGLLRRCGRQEGDTGTLVAGSPRAEGWQGRPAAALGVHGARGEEVKRGERG
jgi:hypothetical protein